MKRKYFASGLMLILLILTWLLPLILPVSALAPQDLPSTEGANSVYLCHLESNQVLLRKNAEASIAPASTVKMMTGLLAIERYGNRLEDSVILTEEMVKGISGTSMKLSVGMHITVKDLLYGTLCGGYNDAAQSLAILCEGSVSSFVAKMNDRAHQLGMMQTNYTNPTGWDDPAMTTTLRDVALLSKEAWKNGLYTTISSKSSYTFYHSAKQESVTIFNRNAMVSGYYATGYLNSRATGLIAGMTDAGGYCVASCIEYDGTNYLCVVMGAEEKNGEIYSYKIANDLLNFMVRNYSYRQICAQGAEICNLPIRLAASGVKEDNANLPCYIATDLYAVLPDTADIKNDLEYRYYFHESEWNAPIQKGTVVGGVDIYFEDENIASTKLIAGKSEDANPILLFLEQTKAFLLGRFFLLSLTFFVILLVLDWFLFEKNHRSLKARKIQYKNFY